MTDPDRAILTRRALLTVAGAGAVAAVAGCTSSPDDRQLTSNPPGPTNDSGSSDVSPVGDAPQPPQSAAANAIAHKTTMLGLIFTTRFQIHHLTQAIEVDTEHSAVFTKLRDDRQAQLTALSEDFSRVFGEAVPKAAPDTSAADAFPTDSDKIAGLLRGDATTAQSKFTDAVVDSSPYQAQLYGAIAACVATHRKVLGAVSSS